MNTLKDFLNKNEIRIGKGKDLEANPPMFYISLYDAFYNYFLTFRYSKKNLPFLLTDSKINKKSIAINYTSEKENIVFTILSFHRFIELLIKDILNRINPLLAVKFIEKDKDLFLYLDNKVNAENFKTVEFSAAYNRLKLAFNHYDNTSSQYSDILKKYDFLITDETKETLYNLSDWRNRIMHNGASLPNIFAFEYLISQRIIPLVNKIICAEKNKLNYEEPYFFKTKTGFNVLEAIQNIKFNFKDFEKDNLPQKAIFNLIKLSHIKEIGRVSFNHNYAFRFNYSYYEEFYENPTARSERFANAEKKHIHFNKIKECICCGAKSLVIYKKELNNNLAKTKEKKTVFWLKCYNCDYSISDTIGDPKIWGFTEIDLFKNE